MRPNGSVPHMFPDDPLSDENELDTADGWVRATAPSGKAVWEGVQMWQGTPGPANWAPEPPQHIRDARTEDDDG